MQCLEIEDFHLTLLCWYSHMFFGRTAVLGTDATHRDTYGLVASIQWRIYLFSIL